jgi:amino acid adenylation domain-containing protein
MADKNLSPAKRALLEKWLQGQLKDDTTSISRRSLNSPVPLSFPQQRQLFLELLEPGTAVNNLSVFFKLEGKLDIAALEQSANKIIARHDALRTRFSFGNGLPTPEIIIDPKVIIPIVNLQQFDINEQMAEARRLAEKEVLKTFDLTKAPLIRIKLYVLNNEKYLLLLVVHHTIADGWSLGVFLGELMIFYKDITGSKSIHLPELPIQYSDYAYWQTNVLLSEAPQSSMSYWKKQLAVQLPVLELPTDHQRGSRQTFSGGTHRFVLPPQLMEAIDKLCRQEDATQFMVLLTTFFILLHRYSGQDEILVGTPIANRNRQELENLIGVFINTLVLRTNISGDTSFRELLKQVRDVSLEAYAHQDLPFEKLVEELNPKRDLSRTPLFQVVFNLQNSPMPKMEIPDLEIVPLEIDRGVSQFDLTLMVIKSESQYNCTVEYNSDLFTPGTIKRMFDSFQLLLNHVLADPDFRISKLKIVDDNYLHHIIHELNQTQLNFPRDKCFHQLFEEQVKNSPDTVAVIYNEKSLTYLELNHRANCLAKYLQSLGIGIGTCVGVLMEKTLEVTEALLAVLKSGGTYIPISTSFPVERIKFILEDSNVQVLLTNLDTELLEEIEINIVNLSNKYLSIAGCTDLQINITPDHLAYIMYTSGSTGKPKGVMVNHSALVSFLWSMQTQPGIKSDDVLLSVTSISFDIAALELFLPLIAGATVVIAGKEIMSNPLSIVDAIKKYNVNMMQATPAIWQLLIESGWTGNQDLKALCGGDALTRKLADQILDRVNSLWNMYGPTETTIWSAVNRIQKENAPITIGQPIGNTRLYILDKYMQPVPIGVAGELHIGGEGLAQGYLNRPELTKEKFIPDPFNSESVARLYKTGDLSRYLPDYSIEILGRTDHQVKIHGYRIELSEIASVLMQHPLVNDAVVITHTENSGEKRLLAYCVLKNNQSLTANELQEFARKKLPFYMIPAAFIQLNVFPLTPNGKIDRRSLPVPDDIRQFNGYVAPGNEIEQILADIWQSVLEVEKIGIHDNFFDLGGASIQSLQVVASASLAGLHLNAESIFEYQTIAELAEQLRENR